jgi:L-ascorbate metabolism protein UlaG (beta-lactamase superfamily)
MTNLGLADLMSGRRLFLRLFVLALSVVYLTRADGLLAQEAAVDSTTIQRTDPRLNEIQNRFLNQQASALLGVANEVIVKFSPQLPEPLERRLAMLLIDGVLHDPYAPQRRPVQEFFHARLEHALHQIEATRVEEGAVIWKLYNHGFIVRTATVTFGFDLVRAHSVRARPSREVIEGFVLSDDLMRDPVSQCDALFISHRHRDHADEWVAGAFIEQGKPVVAPPEIWEGKPIHPQITHLEREAHTVQTLPIQGGKLDLQVVVYPGHQGARIQNNVPLVITPEGMSFVQTGDQWSDDFDDFDWIDEVSQHHEVDVLMPNCWTTDIVRMVQGFDPAVVITGHENEMGHTIDHREPYWLSYQRKTGSERFGGNPDVGYDHPLVLMTWGESYHYKPTAR